MQKASLRQVLLPPRVSARLNNTYFWNLRLKLESHVFFSPTFNSSALTFRYSQIFKYLSKGLEFFFLVYWSSDKMWQPRYKHINLYKNREMESKMLKSVKIISKKFESIFFYLSSKHILRAKNLIWLAKHYKKNFIFSSRETREILRDTGVENLPKLTRFAFTLA